MKRLTILTLGAALLASACAARGASSLGPIPTGSPTPSAPLSPSPGQTSPPTSPTPPAPAGQTVSYEVWVVRDGSLFVTQRTEAFVPAVAQLALDALLDGPSAVERDAEVTSAIPAGAEADITGLSNGVATVDVSGEFFQEQEFVVRRRQAQVVYTLTQFETIGKVRFTSAFEGADPGEMAWSRASFEDLLPAILVESPIIGERVDNPVTISGTANVFEATVSIRILDQGGDEIARTFTTATCGTGCRGEYSIAVPYEVAEEQAGTIEVFESSAADGSPIHVQSIPVTLTP
jgi:hypothetical protein